MFKFKNPFHIPTPVELGRTEYNALPSEKLGMGRQDKDAYTWEKYYEEIKAEFPVRYFINNTIIGGIQDIGYTIKNKWYWLKCHTLPKYKSHKLDLRNPAPEIEYTHGGLDNYEVIEYTCWIMLRRSIESGELKDPRIEEYNENVESTDETEYRNKKIDAYDKLMATYQWLMVGRLDDDKELLSISDRFRKQWNEVDSKKYFDKLKEIQDKTDNAINTIVNYRHYLW